MEVIVTECFRKFIICAGFLIEISIFLDGVHSRPSKLVLAPREKIEMFRNIYHPCNFTQY